ncbi:MAG: ABC transporter ATP-binding protein [Silicimonas sp.]|jgi:putative ABC transport system ATP-binding protein|nr:ABC transporter ATP-binding protein [Silicimonas sp.]
MLLCVETLEKHFPGTAAPVLDGVSMSLEAGEVVALTGESGSGKSTLLHIVAGLEPADGGSVRIEGAELAGMDDAGRARLRRTSIGIVFQQFNLIPSLTVAQNLAFQARLAERTEGLDLPRLAAALGLTDHLAKYPEELSGGQQQRVAIGRAIAPRPRLLMADEPTGNLDESTGKAVFDLLLGQARETGAGLLIVTHSERLAAAADRRLHLSRGKIAT